MDGFEQFLSETAEVPPRRIPHYLRWVRRACEMVDGSFQNPLSSEDVTQVTRRLPQNHETWQVNQARRALRLFRYHRAAYGRTADRALPCAIRHTAKDGPTGPEGYENLRRLLPEPLSQHQRVRLTNEELPAFLPIERLKHFRHRFPLCVLKKGEAFENEIVVETLIRVFFG